MTVVRRGSRGVQRFPGMPPGTPPTTPPVTAIGGASASLIIWTFVGILLGVRSWPFMMSLATFRTFTTAEAAAVGGGGGGGGGASSKVSNCCFGNTSVNHNGTKIRTPTRKHCRMIEKIVAHVLLLRCPLLASSRLSSNRAC